VLGTSVQNRRSSGCRDDAAVTIPAPPLRRVDRPDPRNSCGRRADPGEGHRFFLYLPQMDLSSVDPTSCHCAPILDGSVRLSLLVECSQPCGDHGEITRPLSENSLARHRLWPDQITKPVHAGETGIDTP
jgi:hypothetical protein